MKKLHSVSAIVLIIAAASIFEANRDNGTAVNKATYETAVAVQDTTPRKNKSYDSTRNRNRNWDSTGRRTDTTSVATPTGSNN